MNLASKHYGNDSSRACYWTDRLLHLIFLLIVAGVAGCGHTYVERGPEGEITDLGWSTEATPAGGCWLMTLNPGLQLAMGKYSPPKVVCYVFSAAQDGTQPLFHLVKQATGDHLYTARLTEITEAAELGNAFEDTCCYVYAAPGPGRVPLYRLLKDSTWCHYYTTSESARDSLVTVHGYTVEGVACYVPQDSVGGAVPLYRMQRKSVRE